MSSNVHKTWNKVFVLENVEDYFCLVSDEAYISAHTENVRVNEKIKI